jgi:hypothetical protein
MAGAGRIGVRLFVLAAFALAARPTGHATAMRGAQADEYLVIVHPGNRLRALSRAFVRGAYLKKSTAWGDGEAIHPVGLSRRFPARERFAREVLGKTPAQLRAYWNQQIFSGKGVPPPELDSAEAIIAFVLHHQGAVGYLPAAADPAGAAVVTLE